MGKVGKLCCFGGEESKVKIAAWEIVRNIPDNVEIDGPIKRQSELISGTECPGPLGVTQPKHSAGQTCSVKSRRHPAYVNQCQVYTSGPECAPDEQLGLLSKTGSGEIELDGRYLGVGADRLVDVS